MSRNLRHKRRAKRCRNLAAKACRGRWGILISSYDEQDAAHLCRRGGYTTIWDMEEWSVALMPIREGKT